MIRNLRILRIKQAIQVRSRILRNISIQKKNEENEKVKSVNEILKNIIYNDQESNSNNSKNLSNKSIGVLFGIIGFSIYLKKKSITANSQTIITRKSKKEFPGIHLTPELLTSLVDLTSLNNSDTNEVISKLIKKASHLGPVGAICIYPQFVTHAYDALVKEAETNREIAKVNLATVVNFPKGDEDVISVCSAIGLCIANGAEEIDLVIPYKDINNGNYLSTALLVRAAKQACGDKVSLKVIIESGGLKSEELIRKASKICIENGADFIKTSTGKIPIGATVKAAEIMLSEIKKHFDNTGKWVGFKVSGGVRTCDEANVYVLMARVICGDDYIDAKTFRIGASSLIDDIYKM